MCGLVNAPVQSFKPVGDLDCALYAQIDLTELNIDRQMRHGWC